MTTTQVTPSKIMDTGLGFWASKTLLAAVELDLFTFLTNGPRKAAEIKMELGLHERALYDFLDTLTALGFLIKEGKKDAAKYSNTGEVDTFLVKGRPTYVGGMLQMANHRLYRYWGGLEKALKTGRPQNEARFGGTPLFDAIYANQAALEEFLTAMAGIQQCNFRAIAEKFDFTPYTSFCDMGGADGSLAIVIARKNPHLSCISFDLPAVEPIAAKNIREAGLARRIMTQDGDFFKDDFPHTDIIMMSNILHDWAEEEKITLMKKAWAALPEDGVFIAIENVIDNDRKENTFGLMMSLNMLIETNGGFEYTAEDFEKWAALAGFSRVELIPLTGPASAIVAYK